MTLARLSSIFVGTELQRTHACVRTGRKILKTNGPPAAEASPVRASDDLWRWDDEQDGATMTTIDSVRELTITTVANGPPDDVNEAVCAASALLRRGTRPVSIMSTRQVAFPDG